MFYTYILYSESIDKFYIGSTMDLENRLVEHNSKNDRYTSKGKPWILKYSEIFETRALAVKREKEIKKQKSRKFIVDLINAQ